MHIPSKPVPFVAAPPLQALRLMEPGWVSQPFTSAVWDFELPCEGYRMLADLGGGQACLRSRSGLDATRWFPEIAEALAALDLERTVLDGTVCMLDGAGRCDPRRLHERALQAGRPLDGSEAVFCVRDLLVCDGWDVRPLGWVERRELLQRLPLRQGRVLRLARYIIGEGEWLHRQAAALGRDVIWARRRDAPYRGGRSDGWLLVPCATGAAVRAAA